LLAYFWQTTKHLPIIYSPLKVRSIFPSFVNHENYLMMTSLNSFIIIPQTFQVLDIEKMKNLKGGKRQESNSKDVPPSSSGGIPPPCQGEEG